MDAIQIRNATCQIPAHVSLLHRFLTLIAEIIQMPVSSADAPRVPLGQGRSTVAPRCVCGQEIPLLSVPSQKRLLEGGGLTALGSGGGSGRSTAAGSGVTVMLSAGLWVMPIAVVLMGGVDLLGCSVDVTSSETVGTVGTGERSFKYTVNLAFYQHRHSLRCKPSQVVRRDKFETARVIIVNYN